MKQYRILALGKNLNDEFVSLNQGVTDDMTKAVLAAGNALVECSNYDFFVLEEVRIEVIG